MGWYSPSYRWRSTHVRGPKLNFQTDTPDCYISRWRGNVIVDHTEMLDFLDVQGTRRRGVSVNT